MLGISLAIWTVLLFPLDVANRSSCKVTCSMRRKSMPVFRDMHGLRIFTQIPPPLMLIISEPLSRDSRRALRQTALWQYLRTACGMRATSPS